MLAVCHSAMIYCDTWTKYCCIHVILSVTAFPWHEVISNIQPFLHTHREPLRISCYQQLLNQHQCWWQICVFAALFVIFVCARCFPTELTPSCKHANGNIPTVGPWASCQRNNCMHGWNTSLKVKHEAAGSRFIAIEPGYNTPYTITTVMKHFNTWL